MTKLAAILLFLIFPFGQLLRFNLGNGITVHVNDLVVGMIGFMGIIRGIRLKDDIKLALIVWILAAGISLGLNFHLVGLLYLLRWVAYAGMYFFFRDFKDKNFLARGFLWAILSVAVVGVGQYLLLPDTTFLAASDWDDHSFRLLSTFLDPGFTGIIVTAGLFFIIRFLFFNKFSILQFAIFQTALAFTYSRASYLAYLVGVTVVAISKRSAKLFLGLTLLFLISLTLLPRSYGESTNLGRENSTWARINNWKHAVAVWQTAPIFGVGFGNYQYYSEATLQSHSKAGSDSSILTILATTGIVGLTAYLGVLRGMWVVGRKSLLFKTCLIAVFIHSWFNNTLFYPWVMELMWLVLVFDS